MRLKQTTVLIILLFFMATSCCHRTIAQSGLFTPSDTYRPDRLRKVVIGESVLLAATSIGLYFLWYKAFPKSRFHFIRDGKEWLQIDKIGHAATAYSIAGMHYNMMRWSGVSTPGAINSALITSMAFMSIVEIMDGFSRDWGFSGGDLLANFSGAALFAAQQYYWKEQRIGLKFSAHLTPFAAQNPSLLGKKIPARIMKDYNGQTYWLSANIRSFLPSNSRFPAWLNMAVGYGGEGMLRASKHAQISNSQSLSVERTRQWYLSPDADLFRIKSEQWAKPFSLIPFLKIPAPALEINSKRTFKLHPVYY